MASGWTRRGSVWIAAFVALIAAVAVAVAVWPNADSQTRMARQMPAVPVTVADAQQRDVAIFLAGLGTIQASNTIAIRSQIDGTLQSVNFTEGQEVRAGDTLAVIDPRALQAALDQAVAKKAQDEAQLLAAQKDLDRFKALAAKDYGTQQSVDQQQGKVDQLKATIDADVAAIENAQTLLSYTKITAPIDG